MHLPGENDAAALSFRLPRELIIQDRDLRLFKIIIISMRSSLENARRGAARRTRKRMPKSRGRTETCSETKNRRFGKEENKTISAFKSISGGDRYARSDRRSAVCAFF